MAVAAPAAAAVAREGGSNARIADRGHPFGQPLRTTSMLPTRTPNRRARAAAALALLAAGSLALAACGDDSNDANGGGSDTTAAPTPSGEADVTIRTFQFEIPASLPAGTLTIANADATTHTFTEGAVGNAEPAFDVSVTGPDGNATIEVEPGTYDVHCNIHTSMTGTLVVA